MVVCFCVGRCVGLLPLGVLVLIILIAIALNDGFVGVLVVCFFLDALLIPFVDLLCCCLCFTCGYFVCFHWIVDCFG